MKIHEYQAKTLFKKYGIPVPEGAVAANASEAVAVAERLGRFPVAVKAQVHAGGRGKAGGIKLARSGEEVRKVAGEILGMTLVNRQTGPDGKVVKKILVEQAATGIGQELYLGFIIDRSSALITLMASESGGMDIEEVAASTPERIITVAINPLSGITPQQCQEAASGLNLPGKAAEQLAALLPRLYTLFVGCDCTLVEINPLAVTTDQNLIALDAKADIDGNALFRHEDLAALRDTDEEHPLEVEASKFKLNYIHLDGTVGSMVNGAGLAMATMDLIKQAGAEPANFLDVGGGASAEAIEHGFRIMLKHPKVKVILINIFGGILRCDLLAEGVTRAAEKYGCTLPVVVRMKGTNAEEGRKILSASALNLINADDLADAARKVAQLAAT